MREQIKEIKTATITEKGQICIPAISRVKGFKEGSKISIIVYENKIELRPMKKLSDAMMAMLASEEVLAKSWNTKEEDEAWKDL
ncbi:MAG: AbrB family transcriptional regulator [Candidatus Portnoybacteria bacterium CG09_land_8_20_14_0_10_44_13]|uniref:AbrB family transcriptional regulator n=1 Tax=Candidatus Portnoybacteria bacterium CG09_land_8_20_14_0_10_44_13 TaxID=1974811 RepID=A0A2H0WUU0_9BACT|nr:MAG: AbrB family transcriptional regulator [Candidatus Portnoybacteria bacterium CG09_land_8_20_14_0_10_44_13]